MAVLCIDRCVCHSRTFAELAEAARRHSCTELKELSERVPFGRTCGLCHPYMREVLQTGRVVFDSVVEGPTDPELLALPRAN